MSVLMGKDKVRLVFFFVSKAAGSLSPIDILYTEYSRDIRRVFMEYSYVSVMYRLCVGYVSVMYRIILRAERRK